MRRLSVLALAASIIGVLLWYVRPPAPSHSLAATWQQSAREFASLDAAAYTRDRFDQLAGAVLHADGTAAGSVTISVLSVPLFLQQLSALSLGVGDVLAGRLPCERMTASAADGSFRLPDLTYGSKIVLFHGGEECGRRDLDVLVQGVGVSSAQAELRRRGTHAIEVLDADARPLPGAELLVLGAAWDVRVDRRVADACGAIELPLEPGATVLGRSAADRAWQPVRLDGDRATLTRESPLRVTVLGSLHGAPLELRLARLDVDAAPPREWQGELRGTSLDLGVMPLGRHVLIGRQRAAGLAGSCVLEPAVDASPVLTLAPAATLVIDGGAPLDCELVAGAAITFDPLSPANYLTRKGRVVARIAAGDSRASELPAGSFTLQPFGMVVNLAAGQVTTLTPPAPCRTPTSLFTERPHHLVLVTGKSLAVMRVADAASEVVLAGLPPGSYEARALGKGGRWSLPKGVSQGSGRAVRFSQLDRARDGCAPVYGFVRDASDAPFAGAEVLVQSLSSEHFVVRRAVSDEHGFYRLDDFPAGLPCVLFARKNGDETAVRNLVTLAGSASGARCDLDVYRGELHVRMPPGTRGELERISDGCTLYSAAADGDVLLITNVPPGQYRFSGASRTSLVTVTSSEPHVDLDLRS
ncbi:MAG: carboxypeptidase-like regulatory domain-containing protein [Planctomycetota bacterium]